MKTTLDLPDDLLIEAKAVANRRRTTLKDLITRSLRREIGLEAMCPLTQDSPFEIGELGLPVLKKRGVVVTDEVINQMLEQDDEEELRRVTAGRKP